jgi:RND family efflux transporter MFP subunit
MSSPKPSLNDLRIERPARAGASVTRWLVPLVLVLVVLGLLAFGAWRFAGARAIEVRTAPARAEAAGGSGERTVLNASGYVTARRAATVSSKVTGKVVVVLVEEGMRVQEGQELARLDDTNIKTSLEVALAQLEAANTALKETEAQLKQARLELNRTADLARQQIASRSDLDRAEAEAATLAARLERQQREVAVAERTVAAWRQQLDDTIIRAPFAGVVTVKNAQPGEMISPMSSGGFTRTGICTLVDMDSLEIEIDVNESYIVRVTTGQPVEATLDAYPDWKIPCRVIAIIPTADRQKSTVKVRVGFDKLDPRILPEMGVKVAFREAGGGPGALVTGRAVTVPKDAVRSQNGRDVVFVVQNGRAERRAVSISGTRDAEVTLSAGVSAGERVVLNPPATLADGAVVKEAKL